jgi:Uma2 family endonuclease
LSNTPKNAILKLYEYDNTKKLNFIEFLEQYPDGKGIFELVDGEIVQVEPTRAHKNVARYLVRCMDREIERLELNYTVDKDIIICTVKESGTEQGRNPDVLSFYQVYGMNRFNLR